MKNLNCSRNTNFNPCISGPAETSGETEPGEVRCPRSHSIRRGTETEAICCLGGC